MHASAGPPRPEAAKGRGSRLRPPWNLAAAEGGVSLIEVMISALLVAVIAIGTLTGFEAAGNTASNNNIHDQAALLASESQEELRTDPAPALADLVAESHSYTRTVENRKFTVVQQATLLKNEGDAECGSGSTASDEPSENYEVRTQVTWPKTSPVNRKPVEDASVITPPEGASLYVEANNGGSPHTPVSGATVKAVPAANATSKAGELTAITSPAGCAFFTSLATDLVNFTVSKPGYITTTGLPTWESTDVVLAPNVITRKEATIAEAGAIEAFFTYKGKAEDNGVKVTGDTFVAFKSEFGSSSKFVLGGTKSEYLSQATTELDLFPFSTSWKVFAGDCTADEPPSSIKASEAVVLGGKTASAANVPMSYVALEVWTGTSSSKGSLSTEALPVTITNTGCAGKTPTGVTDESNEKLNGDGALEHPFQPFGSYTLCVYSHPQKRTYTTAAYTNTTEAGTTLPPIFLGGTIIGKNAGTNVTVAEKVETQPANC